ncbi:hypothetical protein N7510_000023 [Penicillium lagena]|uniref:uncharacterized protein n=1 Tax=Penicillium lagena TaxID=94218 RepID=UPI00253F686F|nr:uncharacterized protein N7510_000023 [Penicillium lagena]KAJ5623714.1 hypothetical protein N7510_000023 [Penicillium lagena]
MPINSAFSEVNIPDLDLWSFVLESTKTFADSQGMNTGVPVMNAYLHSEVIYKSADNPGREYTFADVKAAAITFGEGLYHHFDWHKGDILAIYCPNDVDFGSVIFGTFYAGGIVSPANPGYTPDELAFQLRNAGAKALVTAESHLRNAVVAAKSAGIPNERILILGQQHSQQFRHWSDIKKPSEHLEYGRWSLIPDEDLAFLVYSSGTTGLPKGVMLSHRNVVSDLCLITGAVGYHYESGKDKMLGILPFFHVYGLVGLVTQCLYRGIEMLVVRDYEFEGFLQLVQNHKITFVYVAPPVIVRLANDPLAEKFDLRSLRMVTSGAAPLTTELIEKVYHRLGIAINQAYGLSETSPMTHTQPWDEWQTSIGSVGKMFPNMSGIFMSDSGEVKRGEIGELWLAGPNVFKGYWKNEEATVAAIVEQDGRRYLRTGDVGFEDENCNFFITDRVKDLIKYKGFQVAPTELEGKLACHPLVQDAAVVGIYDNSANTEVPRAYIVHATRGGQGCNKETGVPHDHQSLRDAKEIKDWFMTKVASHKLLRGGVRFVDQIPKSAAGKILKSEIKNMAKRENMPQRSRL